MAILIKPSTIIRGQPALFTLNKAELSAIPEIASDSYFSDILNWDRVSFVYKTAVGSTETVTFDATVVSPQQEFLVSDKLRGDLEITAIVIFDFDGDYLFINKEVVQALPSVVVNVSVQTSPFIQYWKSLSAVYSLAAEYPI